jgi:hypothetical protein
MSSSNRQPEDTRHENIPVGEKSSNKKDSKPYFFATKKIVLPAPSVPGALIEVVSTILTSKIDQLHKRIKCTNHEEYATQAITDCFDAAVIPEIGMKDYLTRLVKHGEPTQENIIMMLIYIDRYIFYKNQQSSKDEDKKRYFLNAFNAHRLMALSLFVGIKCHEDFYYNNAWYARIAGITLQEFNQLELEFLYITQFGLPVDPNLYNQYYEYVFQQHMIQRGQLSVSNHDIKPNDSTPINSRPGLSGM